MLSRSVRRRPAQQSSAGLFRPLTHAEYRSEVCEGWFASSPALTLHALGPPLCSENELTDCTSLRGILIALSLGLIPDVKVCPNNKKHSVKLVEEWEDEELRYRWRCCQRGHKCFRSSLCPAGLLSQVSCSMWLPFLYFSNAMRLNYRWNKIQSELQSIFGNSFSDKTMRRWRTLYQSSLQNYLLHHSSMIIGATPGDVVVFDETNLGSQRGISKSSSSGRSSERTKAVTSQRVAKRLPAQTVHRRPAAHLRRPAAAPARRPAAAPLRRPAAVMKSVFNKNKVGTERDTRSQGRWLFAAVLVGSKKTKYTHENGKKRFSFTLLPKPAFAADHKSRGTASMKIAIQSCIAKQAFLVHDAWKASTAAIKSLGLKAAPSINHSTGWRDANTGFHSNDIESEFSRLKTMVRERYGRLCFQSTASNEAEDEVDVGDLYEYTFRVNIGNSFQSMLNAFVLSSP